MMRPADNSPLINSLKLLGPASRLALGKLWLVGGCLTPQQAFTLLYIFFFVCSLDLFFQDTMHVRTASYSGPRDKQSCVP